MALTPEDVVNKRFNPTKFREGYDQDEVDDFLDEVVVELRRLGAENEELRQRLVAADARISELQRAAAQAPVSQPVAVVAPAPEPAASTGAPAYTAPEVTNVDPNNTNNLLQLARRLHEEHVREGIEKRDALIAEGRAAATRIVQEAESITQQKLQEADASVSQRLQETESSVQQRLSDAESSYQSQIGALDAERVELERKVAELRAFEHEYRTKLKDYIQGQLRDLEATESAPTPPTGEWAAPAEEPAAEAPAETGEVAAPEESDPATTGGIPAAFAPSEFPAPTEFPAATELPPPTEVPSSDQGAYSAYPPAEYGQQRPSDLGGN